MYMNLHDMSMNVQARICMYKLDTYLHVHVSACTHFVHCSLDTDINEALAHAQYVVEEDFCPQVL